MVQEGTLVEVPFKTAGEEAHTVLVQFRLIPFTDKPVLLVQDAVVGQHLDSLAPAAVNGLVLGRGHGVEFGQRHLIADGDVRILGDDAAVLHSQQGQLVLNGRCFQDISHSLFGLTCF